MRRGWRFVALMALAVSGCLGYGTIDHDRYEEHPSVLPRHEGDTYSVLLVHEATRTSDLALLLVDCSPAGRPFYEVPKTVTPGPYWAGPQCGHPLGSWGEGKLFQSNESFLASGAGGIVLDGPSGTCCIRAAPIAIGEEREFRSGGRNFTVGLRPDGSFDVLGEGFAPVLLAPGRVGEFHFRDAQGTDRVLRFDHPGGWSMQQFRDPRDDWQPCKDPHYALCHKEWNGYPPEDVVRRHGGGGRYGPREFVEYGVLDSRKDNLSAFLAPILQDARWKPYMYERFEMDLRGGTPTNLTLVLKHGYNRTTITLAPEESDAEHRTGFRVKIVTHFGAGGRMVGYLHDEAHGYDDLTFDDLAAMTNLGASLRLEMKPMPPFGYSLAREVALRAADHEPSRPHKWLRTAEADGTKWRLIHEPCCASGTDVPALVVSKLGGTLSEYSLFRPRDPIDPEA